MTDSFLHPDGHHYRFHHEGGGELKDNHYYNKDGEMRSVEELLGQSVSGVVFFERVESPNFPWEAPSGKQYWLYHESDLDYSGGKMIPPEDFAGLAERLAKQAEMNQ